MSQELINTSVPKGLKPGSKGFCTVAMTAGLPAAWAERLESLSGYRPIFPLGDEKSELNPIAFCHWRIAVAGKTRSVLSRVAFYGADYSQRSNRLATHVLLEPSEQAEGGPAWMMMQPSVMRSAWKSEPQLLQSGPSLPIGTPAPRPCAAWATAMGDAAWGSVLAETFESSPSKPTYVIYKPGTDVLSLFEESLALLPPAKRWEVTFSTFFTDLPLNLTCAWRGVVAGSPAAADAIRMGPRAVFIDLTNPAPRKLEGAYSAAARDGNGPVQLKQSQSVRLVDDHETGQQATSTDAGLKLIPDEVAETVTQLSESRKGRRLGVIASSVQSGGNASIDLDGLEPDVEHLPPQVIAYRGIATWLVFLIATCCICAGFGAGMWWSALKASTHISFAYKNNSSAVTSTNLTGSLNENSPTTPPRQPPPSDHQSGQSSTISKIQDSRPSKPEDVDSTKINQIPPSTPASSPSELLDGSLVTPASKSPAKVNPAPIELSLVDNVPITSDVQISWLKPKPIFGEPTKPVIWELSNPTAVAKDQVAKLVILFGENKVQHSVSNAFTTVVWQIAASKSAVAILRKNGASSRAPDKKPTLYKVPEGFETLLIASLENDKLNFDWQDADLNGQLGTALQSSLFLLVDKNDRVITKIAMPVQLLNYSQSTEVYQIPNSVDPSNFVCTLDDPSWMQTKSGTSLTLKSNQNDKIVSTINFESKNGRWNIDWDWPRKHHDAKRVSQQLEKEWGEISQIQSGLKSVSEGKAYHDPDVSQIINELHDLAKKWTGADQEIKDIDALKLSPQITESKERQYKSAKEKLEKDYVEPFARLGRVKEFKEKLASADIKAFDLKLVQPNGLEVITVHFDPPND